MTTFNAAKSFINNCHCSIRKTDCGEYRVALRGAGEAAAYYTDDLDDAMGTASAMYEHEMSHRAPSRYDEPAPYGL